MKFNKLTSKARKKAVEKLMNAASIEYKRTKGVYERYYLLIETARKKGRVGLWDRRKFSDLNNKMLKVPVKDRNVFTKSVLEYFPTFLKHCGALEFEDYGFLENDLLPYLKSCEEQELKGFNDNMLNLSNKIGGE